MSDPTEETIIGLERLSQYPTHQDCPVENHDITLVATDALSLIAKLQARITEPEAAAGRKLCTDWQCPEAVVSHYNDRPNCVNYRPREVLPPRTQEQTGFPTEAEWDGINKTLASGKREEDAKVGGESKPTSALTPLGNAVEWAERRHTHLVEYKRHTGGRISRGEQEELEALYEILWALERLPIGHRAEETASRAVQRNPQIPVVDDQRRVMTAAEEELINFALWAYDKGWLQPASDFIQLPERFAKAVLAERNSNSDTKQNLD